MKVKTGVSARHLHLSNEDFEFLFGKEEMKKVKDLNQTGEYASNLKVTLKSEKSEINNVRILGPLREYTQIEISKTDAVKLGINPPVRDSGDLKNSASIIICNNDKELKKEYGCIIATRHIHMSSTDALKLGFDNHQKVKVKVDTIKGGILENVFIKIKDNFVFEMHIDTDDANAHLLNNGDICEIIDERL